MRFVIAVFVASAVATQSGAQTRTADSATIRRLQRENDSLRAVIGSLRAPRSPSKAGAPAAVVELVHHMDLTSLLCLSRAKIAYLKAQPVSASTDIKAVTAEASACADSALTAGAAAFQRARPQMVDPKIADAVKDVYSDWMAAMQGLLASPDEFIGPDYLMKAYDRRQSVVHEALEKRISRLRLDLM
jgi:hypothetical protein